MEVVNNIIDKSKIPIKFIDKPNGGKHTAWCVATKVFEGRYVVTCDDDPIIDNMLEVLISIGNNKNHNQIMISSGRYEQGLNMKMENWLEINCHIHILTLIIMK